MTVNDIDTDDLLLYSICQRKLDLEYTASSIHIYFKAFICLLDADEKITLL